MPAPCSLCGLKTRLGGLLLLFGMLGTTPGLGADAAPSAVGEVEYAFPIPSVWTSRLNARGEPENPLFPLADALFRKAGQPWHGASYPAARMFENLRSGRSDFSMLVSSPALLEYCLVSRKPVASTELRVYRLANQAPVGKPGDLAGKSVITVLGYSYGGLLGFLAEPRNAIANHAVSTHEAAFAMLEKGRADYLLDYVGPANEILAAHPIRDIKSELLQRLDVHLVVSKQRPDAEQLMARLEAAAEAVPRPPGRSK